MPFANPTVIVDAINAPGTTYANPNHIKYGGDDKWFALADGTWSLTSSAPPTGLKIRLGAYNQFIGANVDTDPESETFNCITTTGNLVFQVVSEGGFLQLKAPE